MSTYHHTQKGTFARTTFGVLTVICIVAALFLGPGDSKAYLVLACMGFAMFIGLILFHCLTVEIARGYLRLRFGVGLIRRQFRLNDIESYEQVRNKWWYGWGIKLTPHGWMFNVSGFDALQIRLKNGRQYRIGTDEPESLLAAIEAAMRYS